MKSCLIYTVKNDAKHLSDLLTSLLMAKENLIPFVQDMDILFFYDPGIEERVNNILKFVQIFRDAFLLSFTTKPPPGYEKTPLVQYKNMCRFWAGEVFRQPKVQEYDYYMRLDCDSFITEPLGYDPFGMMAAEDKDYAFTKGGKFRDVPEYSQGLNAALKEFESQFPERMKNPVSTLIEGMLYYTNFEICRVKAFSEGLYQSLFDHIERVQGIYKYRWGDHIIRYAGIHMLLGFDRVKEITDMKYTHQYFVNGVMG